MCGGKVGRERERERGLKERAAAEYSADNKNQKMFGH